MPGFEHMKGSEPARGALEELVRIGRRSVAVYRAAERRVEDHRVQAALAQLRRDHQRHVRELSSIVAEIGGAVVAWDGAAASGPLLDALRGGAPASEAMLDALKRTESSLRAAYAAHVARGLAEPLRAVLSRHLRVEEAHRAWLEESRWWRRPER